MNNIGFFLLLSQFIITTSALEKGEFIYTYKNGTVVEFSLFKNTFIPDRVKDIFYILSNNYEILIMIWCAANFLAIACISKMLYGEKRKRALNDSDDASDSEFISDSDDESYLEESVSEDTLSESEEINYESQYFEQLEEMQNKILSSAEFKLIACHRLKEETPKGVVIMSYNTETGVFDYYTDKFADISYEILDTVARLFAITYDCKQICVNYRNEIKNGENKMLSQIEFDKMQKEKEANKELDKSKERSVFATFKSYNKKSSNNVDKKYYIITENANRFKYKGKLSDYEKMLIKDEFVPKTGPKIGLSYSDYKQMRVDSSSLDTFPEPSMHEPSMHQPSMHEPSMHEPSMHEPSMHQTTIRDFYKQKEE
jgi:hypothetical protein